MDESFFRSARLAPPQEGEARAGYPWSLGVARALLAYPGALILRRHAEGVEPVAFDDAEPVRLTRAFLDDPARFLHELTR